MFAKPRPKKSILPPPSKKRKTATIEEISFDNDARHEYLTGFHKRKQQRIKHAQEEAAKKARQERIEIRKQAREDRKREVEEHVTMVNKMLEESGAAGAEGQGDDSEEADAWEGFPDRPDLEMIDHEEEYIDEDRYTTVTVESVNVSRDGFEKPVIHDSEDEDQAKDEGEPKTSAEQTKEKRPPKPKKKKFRYETKFERKLTDSKQRAKNHKRR